MKITVDIVDRNYAQIEEFCDANGMSVEDYVVQCVEDTFFTMKYGDINEKIYPARQKDDVKKPKEGSDTPKEVVKNEKEPVASKDSASSSLGKIAAVEAKGEEFMIRAEDAAEKPKTKKRSLKAR